ncbi:sulfite exporter TauE/SafE family protein [Acetivibrio cellulolyticus]|uniref:sulfite exporter TauE/SafE family protein n=1 Tax=Acetivibrio cellulolyticus TaxID=35830 RepID=UPI0001E2CCC9|nr:sulfite exporter TauE/SafE family protein [Acetivibrio cellulolyticus]
MKKYIKYILIGLATGLANGLFGSGGGTIAVPAMVLLLNEEEHKAHATAISIILPLTVVSAILYMSNNFINWNLTAKVMIGGIIGGYIGAKLLNICPSNILRKIFAVFMIAAAIRMIL